MASEKDIEDYAAILKSQGHSDQEVGAYKNYLKDHYLPKDSWLDKGTQIHVPLYNGLQGGTVELTPRGAIQGTANALPAVGAGLGAAVGSPTGPIGAIGGSAMGGAAGNSLKDLIEQHVLGKEKTVQDYLKSPVVGGINGALQEVGGQALGKALNGGGKMMYKAGLKKLDQVAEAYGKEPISDLLMRNRVTGSAKNIQEAMDRMAEARLEARNKLLQEATANGAEVDMGKATTPAQAIVDKMRKIDNPELQSATEALQRRVDLYKARTAQESEDILRSLPAPQKQTLFSQNPTVQGYVAPTEIRTRELGPPLQGIADSPMRGSKLAPGDDITNIINNPRDRIVSLPVQGNHTEQFAPGLDTVFDQSDRVAGPTPMQTSAWKTTAANNAGDQAYNQIRYSPEAQGFDKALSRGLKQATEDSVGQFHPRGQAAADQLSQQNSELGQLLTTQDRAARDAAIEENKNGFTSVDGILLHRPDILAAKKLADATKSTWFRTNAGLRMQDLGQRAAPGTLGTAVSPVTSFVPNYVDQNYLTPWLNMNKDQNK